MLLWKEGNDWEEGREMVSVTYPRIRKDLSAILLPLANGLAALFYTKKFRHGYLVPSGALLR